MKKRIVLVLLLVALVAVAAFASDRIRFTTGSLNGVIQVNWVETSRYMGKTNIYVNYTVIGDVESMVLCTKVTNPAPGFGVWNKSENYEALVSKGKTYTASLGTSIDGDREIEVWVEKVKMK